MQVNANVRNRNGTFGRCQQLESDVDMAEEAELQRLAGRRAPIPAVRAATDASAATGVWYVPANPVGPRTAAEGEGEGSAEALVARSACLEESIFDGRCLLHWSGRTASEAGIGVFAIRNNVVGDVL